MSRKVRHIHASSNEYIAVHRNYRGYSGGSSSDDMPGCIYIIISFFFIALAIYVIGIIIDFVAQYWHMILLFLLSAASLFLLIYFHNAIFNGLKKGYYFIKNFYYKMKSASKTPVSSSSIPNPTLAEKRKKDPNYGKIRQKKE